MLVFLLVILLVLNVVLAFFSPKNEKGLHIFQGMVISFIAMSIIIISENKNKPKAIDVYRHKTELNITSVNGVPQDTTVVFKKGFENK